MKRGRVEGIETPLKHQLGRTFVPTYCYVCPIYSWYTCVAPSIMQSLQFHAYMYIYTLCGSLQKYKRKYGKHQHFDPPCFFSFVLFCLVLFLLFIFFFAVKNKYFGLGLKINFPAELMLKK